MSSPRGLPSEWLLEPIVRYHEHGLPASLLRRSAPVPAPGWYHSPSTCRFEIISDDSVRHGPDEPSENEAVSRSTRTSSRPEESSRHTRTIVGTTKLVIDYAYDARRAAP
ncbi:hypothetical protein ACCO45_011709 [Purpureocillium lilacinum]|uniref:Uncharacterized protein n=1 Tax=Purpureocillium lilacinum TaxID=33203 RepID=A0ACC4DEI7_PURLI